MEKNLILTMSSLGEVWELPDSLVLKLEEYKTEHPVLPDQSNADEIHQAWFDTLTPGDQQSIRRKPAESTTA